mgnify:CR=1 FL=1
MLISSSTTLLIFRLIGLAPYSGSYPSRAIVSLTSSSHSIKILFDINRFLRWFNCISTILLTWDLPNLEKNKKYVANYNRFHFNFNHSTFFFHYLLFFCQATKRNATWNNPSFFYLSFHTIRDAKLPRCLVVEYNRQHQHTSCCKQRCFGERQAKTCTTDK